MKQQLSLDHLYSPPSDGEAIFYLVITLLILLAVIFL